MAARAIASVTVSFGLVSIPVKLYSATQASAGVSFNLLHKDCGSRLKQQYLCAKEGVVVERTDMVKGYEFAKDQYVIFAPEELKELEEKGTHTIEVTAFVPAASIDPIYYDKAYYLAPDKGGARPYALLAEGMRKTGRCALGRWAARGKQHIIQLRAVEGGLVLQQLLYAEEVRKLSEIEVEAAQVKGAELDLAVQLIEQHAADAFDPSAYEDAVKQRIEAAVQRKIEGREVSSAAEPESGGAQVIDLMEALRASLAKSTAAGTPASQADATKQTAQRKPPKRVQQEEARVRTPAKESAKAGKK
jgi:DNA end-binding protein Ku